MRLNFNIMPKKIIDSMSGVQLQQWIEMEEEVQRMILLSSLR